MSQSVRDFEKTGIAAADLSAKQFYFVRLDSVEGQIELPTAATDAIVGILQTQPESGQAGTYRFGGTSKLKLGVGGATIGAWITSDASGTGIVTTTDGNMAVRALEAGAEGDIIEVQLPLITLFIA